MKNFIKYVISVVIFFCIYVSMQLLFVKSINWRVVIVSTIMYAILNTVCHVLLDKIVGK